MCFVIKTVTACLNCRRRDQFTGDPWRPPPSPVSENVSVCVCVGGGGGGVVCVCTCVFDINFFMLVFILFLIPM